MEIKGSRFERTKSQRIFNDSCERERGESRRTLRGVKHDKEKN